MVWLILIGEFDNIKGSHWSAYQVTRPNLMVGRSFVCIKWQNMILKADYKTIQMQMAKNINSKKVE